MPPSRLFYGVGVGDKSPDNLFDDLGFVSDEYNALRSASVIGEIARKVGLAGARTVPAARDASAPRAGTFLGRLGPDAATRGRAALPSAAVRFACSKSRR